MSVSGKRFEVNQIVSFPQENLCQAPEAQDNSDQVRISWGMLLANWRDHQLFKDIFLPWS